MCEQAENNFLDGEIVWVKLGSCWWPGEVVGSEKLPPDLLPSFRKPPIAVVKFFQEDTFEYVKNLSSIFKYNCSRKNEFINKGLYMYRTKHGHMEKFPEDVIRAETAVGGDMKILTRDEFQETKKESYAGLFGDPKKTPTTSKRGKSRPSESPKLTTPIKKLREKTNYKVHILLQGSKTPNQTSETASTPSTSRAGSEPSETHEKEAETKSSETEKPQTTPIPTTPVMSSTGQYVCHACQFTTTRLNVLILHNKTHSVTYIPYTPSPIKKISVLKTPKSTPATSKTQKQRKPRQEKSEKKTKKSNALSQKRSAESEPIQDVKKPKTDEEIKSSLLADWDDGDEESNDESSTIVTGSPEVPVAAESPAVPTPAELPTAQIPGETQTLTEKKADVSPSTEKPESSSDSKYEFCEDEDWPVEADVGRKIPRIKNPSKRKSETKSISIDDDDMAREVAELLNKTNVPELPSAPEPLKVEENFPEPSIVKSPDKQSEKTHDKSSPDIKNVTDNIQPQKTIFKTKTFFRSRHSRSQDAIGKYVAEQLNAAERMDLAENELNGSDVNSLEMRVSSPIEHVKVARLAPKIQLKKMKAEAAQLREREKCNPDKYKEDYTLNVYNTELEASIKNVANPLEEKENSATPLSKEIPPDIIRHKKYDKKDVDNQNSCKKQDDIVPEFKVSNDDIVTDKNHCAKELQNAIIEKASEVNDNSCVINSKANDIEKSHEPFMNESTASAVDALLSVSREADRVTKVISDDPPEDLFDEDIKDVNGLSNAAHKAEEDVEESNGNDLADTEFNKLQLSSYENSNVKQDGSSCNNILQESNISDLNNLQDKDVILKTNQEFECNVPVPNNVAIPEFLAKDPKQPLAENIPSESDLQVAEALINLPTTTLQNNHPENNVSLFPEEAYSEDNPLQDTTKLNISEDVRNSTTPPVEDTHINSDNDKIKSRFETEEEKSENLSAAKSLVQMSETVDHKMNIDHKTSKEMLSILKSKDGEIKIGELSPKITPESECNFNMSINDCNQDTKINRGSTEFDKNSSKLLKILEEPCVPKAHTSKKTITKQVIVPAKEKILNFDVGKPTLKPKPQSPKQKIIIRRTTANKNILNNMNEITTPDKIILSRTNKSAQDGSPVQTYTIQTTPEPQPSGEGNTIIIQQKIRKIGKPMVNMQKINSSPQTSPVSIIAESKSQEIKNKDDAIFDINSMPVVLSDDILTPESIEKMPIVMSDGNIITNTSNPTKIVKNKHTTGDNEKISLNPVTNKSEIKTFLMNSNNEITKSPNILSKSSKLRGAKPMLVIDKITGKQKIIMTKTEQTVKEVKQPQTIIQTAPQTVPKAEKFIILPTQSSPRSGKSQKIVIDHQTGKAHVLVGKGTEPSLNIADNKPVSAKLVPSATDANMPGNTVMIITNAQGAQSRIVLTPEHEKILFPNKNQSVSQLKPVLHRITSNAGIQKTVVTTGNPTKTQTKIVPKQKSAIITSKGQLIVGGRISTTTQSLAPLPEIRPAPKRILAAEPKKLVQTIQKNSPEALIFLQQKSGTVMQLTASQFEHLRRTGQIIHKAPQEKVIVQKSITISPNENIVVPALPKNRARKQINDSPTPTKKIKHEIAIAPAPSSITALPALTPLSNTITSSLISNISTTLHNASSANYSDLDNIEELLPSTAIARQDARSLQPEIAAAQPPPASLSDGQLLAVPGEHFGGPTGSFYLCVEENGTFTVIDNRPLVLENNQLVPMAEPLPILAQPERRDILEAALANSDVFHGDTARDDAPDFRDLNANVSVHCRVSETSTTLNQPIMTPVEMPTKADAEPTVPSNLEDGLAVIGLTPLTVPTSLELPITVTDPRIAPKTTDPLSNNNYGTALLPSPNRDIFAAKGLPEMVVGPISMPILTDDDPVGKSMPILTDDVTDRTVSSVESTVGSPCSIDVRESENEDSGQWSRRLLTPCSDMSETSAEIPLQPVMQLSMSDLSQKS